MMISFNKLYSMQNFMNLFLIFCLIHCCYHVNCETSFASSILDTLGSGKIDRNLLNEKFGLDRPKCVQGSYFYNGSCYFISNHRLNFLSSTSSQTADILFGKLLQIQDGKSLIPNSLQSTFIGTQAVSMILPKTANWFTSASTCRQLHNESTLIYFDNYKEYEFLINLLFRLKFNNNETDYMKEESFYIGLYHNRTTSTWKWLNDMNLTDTFFMPNYTNATSRPLLAQLPLLEKRQIDYIYRPCAYLYIRGNGDINIDIDNCERDQKPYICKYVLDRCYNNTKCGLNGECVNLPFKKSFECRCRILYDGKYCQKWSAQGVQMISAAGLVIAGFVITVLAKLLHSLFRKYKNRKEAEKSRQLKTTSDNVVLNPLLPQRVYSIEYFNVDSCALCLKYMKKNIKFLIVLITSLALACFLMFMVTYARYKLIENRYEKFKTFKKLVLFHQKNQSNSTNHTMSIGDEKRKNDLVDTMTNLLTDSKLSAEVCKLVEDSFVEDYIVVLVALPLTLFIYIYNSFWCTRSHTHLCKFGKLKIKRQANAQVVRRSQLKNDNINNTTIITNDYVNVDIDEQQENFYQDQKQKNQLNSLQSNQVFGSDFESITSTNFSLGSTNKVSVAVTQIETKNTYFGKLKSFIQKLKLNRKDETKRAALCCCTCRFEVLSPMNPFSKKNRFITAIIYAAYTYNILKIFEYLLMGDQWAVDDVANDNINRFEKLKNNIENINPGDVTKMIANFGSNIERGVLTDLLKQILNVFIIGLRYYPILLCIEMKHKRALCYFLCSCYMWAVFIFYLYTNTVCLLLDNDENLIDEFKSFSRSNNNSNLTSILDDFYKDHIRRNITFLQPRRKNIIRKHNDSILAFTEDDNYTNSSEISRIRRNNELKFNFMPSSLSISASVSSSSLKDSINIKNVTTMFKNHTNNTNTQDEDNFIEKQKRFIFLNNIMYEKLILYIVLCIITIHLTVETVDLVRKKVKLIQFYFKKLRKNKSDKKDVKSKIRVSSLLFNDNSNREVIKEFFNLTNEEEEENVETIKTKPKISSRTSKIYNEQDQSEYMSAEMLYTKKIFQRKIKAKSFIKYLFEKYIYKFKMHFKYSKQLINTYVISFILLYFITCIIIRKSKLIINITHEILQIVLNFIFKMSISGANAVTNGNNDPLDAQAIELAAATTRKHLNTLINYLFSTLGDNIVISCCLTSFIYVVQLLLGIKNYQKHILNAYKGAYVDIPSPKRFTNTKKAASSMHYSGYMIGYLLNGYVILFEVMIILIVVVKFLMKFYFVIEKLGKIFLPILVIFLFKRLLIWYITRYFLIKHKNINKKYFLLKNTKLYYILTHFNFFFDCFLGTFVCFIRMAQSSLAALFFMPRLDYSVYGRMLERNDMGFISYVNFIHLEVNQSHPIKIAFCELLVKTIKEKYNNLANNDGGNSKSFKYRNRWFLALTLARVNGLYKQRKKYLKKHERIPKVESFEQFLERKVRIRSIGSIGKISKSKSTLTVNTLDDNHIDTITSSSNATIDSTFIKKKFKKINEKKIIHRQNQEQHQVTLKEVQIQRERKLSLDSLDFNN